MRKGIKISVLAFFLFFFICIVRAGDEKGSDKMKENQLEEGYEKGVSGAYAGRLGDIWVVAGGCNFPEDPLNVNSAKKYYQGIYEIILNPENPKIGGRIGELPLAMAYGGAVNYGESMVIVGGADAFNSFSDVFKLSLDSGGSLVTEVLPSLPDTSDNFGLAVAGSRVYLVGGNIGGVPSNKLYVLDMEATGKGWQNLQPFPGNPRIQPIVESSKDKDGRECIYLWGGFAPKGDGREASLNTDGYKYDINSDTWSYLQPPLNRNKEEVSLGGGASVILNDGRIGVAGGVNKDIFLAALKNQPDDYLTHPAEWYKFNNRFLIFNPITEEWTEICEDSRLARAGANLFVTDNDEIILTGGELKPRIRTADIFKMKIDKND